MQLTPEGYLIHFDSWTPEIAEKLAAIENINITDAHWEVINLLREFYQEYEAAPAIGTLVRAMRSKYGTDKGNSIYLHTLFPGAAKQATKIAGLPRPIRCI